MMHALHFEMKPGGTGTTLRPRASKETADTAKWCSAPTPSMADEPLQRQRSATQRRVEDAVGGIGVIESGLPPRVRRKDSALRSSDLVSERSAPSSHAGGARGRGTVRTNRRMSLMVGRASRDTGNEILPEGRARVAKCEVAERRFCGMMGIAGKGARKTILHPLRVDVPPGSVTAILGTAERYVGYYI